METEVEPNETTKNIKWHNRRDEAYGLLCLNISRDILFHLNGLTSLNEVWEKLQYLFWKKYNMRGYQLNNELIALSPSSFETLQVYLSKFKSLVLQLKYSVIDNEDE